MDSVNGGMAAADWAVVAAYFVVVIGLGLWASRGRTDTGGFFLASRSSTWPTIGLALIASNISGTTLIGLAGAAYGTGISVFNYEWMAALVLAFYALFVLPAVLRSRVFTMPEFLERRYSPEIRLYFSALTIVLNIIVDTAATLFGGAVLFQLIFPDAPLWLIAACLAVAAGVYTAVGGLKAVMVTEVVQAVVLLAASVLVAGFAFAAAGGWDAVMAGVPAEKLGLIRPNDDPGVPWIGLLTGVPLLGFYFWCTNQFMAQRVMSAKSLEHGRWGSLFAGLLKLPILYLMVLPGTAAILLYPELPRPDAVYPTLVFDLLPVGVVGVVIAGFLAAIMSSIASTFNSGSTLVTMDFVRRFAPHWDDAALVRTGRVVTLVFMALAVAWVPVIDAIAGSLWSYLQSVLAYAVPPVVALFLAGLFWPRANVAGARAGLIVGTAAAVWMFTQSVVLKTSDTHFLVAAAILFLLSLAALFVGSLLTPAPDVEAQAPLRWRPEDWTAETAVFAARPAWQNPRLQALVLVAATLALVWAWRGPAF